MSRNNKSARRTAEKRRMHALHKSGGKGPEKTQPVHGKKRRIFNSDARIKARILIVQRSRVVGDTAPVAKNVL